jgi:hypothetical protein
VEIVLRRRYRGPLTSANGGYACGRLAAFVHADEVEVTLRLPPPLDRPLAIENEDGRVLLLDGDDLVAEARAAPVQIEPPPAVSLEDAAAARSRHVRGADEEFNECYVCGVRDDGLEVRVGPVAGREPLHAAPAELRESGPEFVWAAIDCAGAYAVGAEGRGDIVLGRMTARVDRVPDAGEECVVAAWPLGEDGRKLFAGTALYSAGGALMAVARQTWIAPRA